MLSVCRSYLRSYSNDLISKGKYNQITRFRNRVSIIKGKGSKLSSQVWFIRKIIKKIPFLSPKFWSGSIWKFYFEMIEVAHPKAMTMFLNGKVYIKRGLSLRGGVKFSSRVSFEGSILRWRLKRPDSLHLPRCNWKIAVRFFF